MSEIINSKAQNNEDDTSITIICTSIIDDNMAPRTPNSSHSHSGNGFNTIAKLQTQESSDIDFIYVEQDRLQSAQELEKIIQDYAEDLKRDNKSEIHCSRQLVIRLMDVIRVAYSKDSTKLQELDKMMKQIDESHDTRFIQEKEKIEQYKVEIANLTTQLLSMKAESHLVSSYPNSINQTESFQCVEEWSEFEDDTNRLRRIVEQQQEYIHQILKLINDSGIDPSAIGINQSQLNTPYNIPPSADAVFKEEEDRSLKEATVPSLAENTEPLGPTGSDAGASPIFSTTTIHETTPITPKAEPSNIPNSNISNDNHQSQTDDEKKQTAKNSLFLRFQENISKVYDHENPPTRTITNISPGSSPTTGGSTIIEHMMEWAAANSQDPGINAPADATTKETVNDNEDPDKNLNAMAINQDEIDDNEEENYSACPMCSKTFPTSPKNNRETIYDHIEICLAPSGPPRPRKQPDLICPICEKKFPHTDEALYHRHINDCLNARD